MALTIGVFDSGIGGEAVARALAQAFPDADIITVNDREHLPYGDKSPQEVQTLTDAAIQPLLGSSVIVIACNTATTLALPFLRTRYPAETFVGIEPMMGPAARTTQKRVVCVCATPATLASDRYIELKQRHMSGIKVIEPDCSEWAIMIEHNNVNEDHIRATIIPALESGADSIVLGCTHYHWIKDLIEEIAEGRAVVLEPSEIIVRHIQVQLAPSLVTELPE